MTRHLIDLLSTVCTVFSKLLHLVLVVKTIMQQLRIIAEIVH